MSEHVVKPEYEEVKRLMDTLKPEIVVRLKPGERMKLGDLVIEMRDDGITIYYAENGSQE